MVKKLKHVICGSPGGAYCALCQASIGSNNKQAFIDTHGEYCGEKSSIKTKCAGRESISKKQVGCFF